MCTLVKLNFAGLNGSDTLFIGTGFLRLVNRNSFNCRQIQQVHVGTIYNIIMDAACAIMEMLTDYERLDNDCGINQNFV